MATQSTSAKEADNGIARQFMLKFQHPQYQTFNCQKLSNSNSVAPEQNNDVILQQLKLTIRKEEYLETILSKDSRYQRYFPELDRMSIQDEIITRQNFDKTGTVKYNQVL